MKRFYLAALMCAALSFAGCDKNSGSEPEPPVEYDVTMEASAFAGSYFGQEFGNNMEYRYFVYLSDGDTFRPENHHYYQFDIYSNEGAADPENIKLPAGTYTLGVSGETAAGTFTPNSFYMDNTEDGGMFRFESGEIVVSYDGDNIVVDATLVDDAGYSHHVTYTGPCIIDDNSSGSEPEPPVEYDVTMEASAFAGSYFGQEFGNNMEYRYFVYLSDGDTFRPENHHYYQFDIYSNEGAADPENIKLPAGTYTLGVSGETAAGTFTPNSFYMDNTEDGGMFRFESGEIVVSYDGDNIVVDATLVDDAGYSHHVTYTGACSIDNVDSSARSSFDSRNPKFVKVINAKPMARKIAKR